MDGKFKALGDRCFQAPIYMVQEKVSKLAHGAGVKS